MARPARTEVIQADRKRRRAETLDRVHHMRLAIPAEFKGDKEHEYRWINDENSRVYDLTVEDDWDICKTSQVEAVEDQRVRRQVGTKKTGEPLYAYLVRKPKDWYDEDKRKEAAARTGREDALLKKPETDDPQAAQAMYVAGGSSIKRRSGAYTP